LVEQRTENPRVPSSNLGLGILIPFMKTPDLHQSGNFAMTYFTCQLIKNVGIGDQLYQLQTLYNLGKSMGLKYIHSPLLPSRWCQNLDLSQFLGLDIGEETLESFASYKIVNIDAHKAATYFVSGKDFLKTSTVSTQSKVIYKFVFSDKLYFENKYYVDVPLKFKFNFRKKFLAAQKKSQDVFQPFKGDLISIAVHIRRGDCTWLEDNGKYFFPYMNKIIDINPDDVDIRRAVPHEDYLKLLDTIFEQYNQNLFELRIYSDGIPEKFWMEMNLFRKIQYRLASGKLAFLFNRSQQTTRYNNSIFHDALKRRFLELKNRFNVYKKYSNVTLRIGNDVALTQEIITAFATADIAIVARENSFPEVGLRDQDNLRILMNVKTDQSKNISRIEDLITHHSSGTVERTFPLH
jgi:hypothetical protein